MNGSLWTVLLFVCVLVLVVWKPIKMVAAGGSGSALFTLRTFYNQSYFLPRLQRRALQLKSILWAWFFWFRWVLSAKGFFFFILFLSSFFENFFFFIFPLRLVTWRLRFQSATHSEYSFIHEIPGLSVGKSGSSKASFSLAISPPLPPLPK